MKTLGNTLRGWLHENGYKDVANLIEQIVLNWQKAGNKQRRNWWDMLAGDSHGKPRKISGKEIPVLRIAQIRMGREITENALCLNENEVLPASLMIGGRTNNKPKAAKKIKTKKTAKKTKSKTKKVKTESTINAIESPIKNNNTDNGPVESIDFSI